MSLPNLSRILSGQLLAEINSFDFFSVTSSMWEGVRKKNTKQFLTLQIFIQRLIVFFEWHLNNLWAIWQITLNLSESDVTKSVQYAQNFTIAAHFETISVWFLLRSGSLRHHLIIFSTAATSGATSADSAECELICNDHFYSVTKIWFNGDNDGQWRAMN